VGVPPASIEFAYSRYGKPSLSNGTAIGAVRFNATGSDAVGMVAVRRDAEVGIDVERLRDFPDALAVAKRMLTSNEQNELRVLSGDMRAHRFFEYWARKEAVVKSLARGVWQPFDDFTPVPSDTEAMDCVRLSYEGAESREWVMTLASPRPGFVAALSTGAPVRVVRGFLLGTAAETTTE
jgi:4'-phosphopantetheinyl transferase